MFFRDMNPLIASVAFIALSNRHKNATVVVYSTNKDIALYNFSVILKSSISKETIVCGLPFLSF